MELDDDTSRLDGRPFRAEDVGIPAAVLPVVFVSADLRDSPLAHVPLGVISHRWHDDFGPGGVQTPHCNHVPRPFNKSWRPNESKEVS